MKAKLIVGTRRVQLDLPEDAALADEFIMSVQSLAEDYRVAGEILASVPALVRAHTDESIADLDRIVADLRAKSAPVEP